MKFWNNFPVILLGCVTLGLAPFFPEPHIWEKLRWIFTGGGPGWAPIHIFDVFLHGFPWILMIRLGVVRVIALIKRKNEIPAE